MVDKWELGKVDGLSKLRKTLKTDSFLHELAREVDQKFATEPMAEECSQKMLTTWRAVGPLTVKMINDQAITPVEFSDKDKIKGPDLP